MSAQVDSVSVQRIEPKDINRRLLLRELAKRIRDRRKHLGLRQQDLADRALIQRTVVANMETGRSQPQIFILCRVALALGCDVCDLLPSVQAIVPHYRAARPARVLTGRRRRAAS